MFPALMLAAAFSTQQCWDIFDGALRHNALGAHPAYISYDERISVIGDDEPLIDSLAHIDYRDDGVARILDQRFNYFPIHTRHAEPGPPELGPYGAARSAWLPLVGASDLPVISSVHVPGTITCTVSDIEDYKGHRSYHLTFGSFDPKKPAIKAIWIDTASQDVWKLIVSGYVMFVGSDQQPPLADFQVELAYVGPFLVVNHVVWELRVHEFSQYANYFGEYTLSGFEFPNALPADYFGEGTQR